jgi:hypothetical protein
LGGGGSKVCILLSQILYLKHAHFAFLMLAVEYWGQMTHAPNKAITIT